MNKNIFALLLITMLSPFTLFAQQEQWAEAADAYAQKDYATAVSTYESLFEYGVSADLYYNYANALYKTGDIGNAILNYERALLLEPRNEEVKANLEFVNSQITDRIIPMETFFLNQWLHAISQIFESNTWAYISVAFFLLFLSLLMLYLFSKMRWLRKTAFFICIAFFIVFIASFSYSFTTKSAAVQRAEAIVLAGSVSVKSSPDQSGIEIFVLHEGTKLKVVSTLGHWYEVQIADGNIGWIPTEVIERI